MKKLLFLPLALMGMNANAEQLYNYNQVKEAIASGKLIRIYIDYAACTTTSKDKIMPSYSGAYTPNEIGINNDAGYIAASLMHFTLNNPAYPNQSVHEFNRYTIFNDGRVTLAYQALKAADYSPFNDKITFNCVMNKSAKIFV